MALALVMTGGAGATKFIRNDATGGDCTSFGIWDNVTKTCTMTSDLIETIQIDSNGTTLDGDGYQTAGSGTGYGVNLTGRSGVTIKNLNVGQFYDGFYLLNSNNNYLTGNTASSNYNGIYLSGSSSNMLSGNNADTNSNFGIFLGSSSSNTLSSNNANSNLYGIYLFYSDNNTLNSNNANTNTEPGIVLSYSKINNLTGNNANLNKYSDGIYLDSSSSNMLNDNNANSNNGNGIAVSISNSNRLNNNIVSSNKGHGISLYPQSSSNTLSANFASSNNAGILVYSSSNSNKLIGNNASNNKYGIDMETDSNTVSGNIVISNSGNGLYLSGSGNNIYNNLFNNTINLVIHTGSNTWNKAKTPGTNIIGGPNLGGNFWAYPNGTGFSQTCTDVDVDGICDSTNVLDSNNIDYLPLTYNIVPPASVTNLTNITYAQTYINWTWADPKDPDFANVSVWIDGAFKENIPKGLQFSNATGLIPDTVYEIKTRTVDKAGNINATWVNATARTQPSGAVPPVADCGADKLRCENVASPVSFNASASYDSDGAIVSYNWDFGDGSNSTGVTPVHKYSTYRWNGTAYQPFTLNLTVTDNGGMTNSTSGKVVIWIAGDANGDGKVNILDASIIGLKWGTSEPCADLNNDGKVNILDASIIGLNWGKTPIIQ
jgi:parallel beta-helix repeat protein